MVAGTVTVQIESKVGAKRLWTALVKDHDFIVREIPELCAGVTFVEGNGGVGRIKQINFTPCWMEFDFIEERVDVVDEDNFVYNYSDLEGREPGKRFSCWEGNPMKNLASAQLNYLEGRELGENLASAQFTLKLSPTAGGGSFVTHICKFETLPGVSQQDAKLEALKAQLTALGKMKAYVTKAHVMTNPAINNT